MDEPEMVTIPAHLLISLVATQSAWVGMDTDEAARELDDAILFEARQALHEQAPEAVAANDAQMLAAFGGIEEATKPSPALMALMDDPSLRPEHKRAMASIYRSLVAPSVIEAITADPRLKAEEKAAVLGLYRSFAAG